MSDDNGVRSWEENLENLRKERARKNERILQNTKTQSTIPQFDNVFDEVVDSANVVDSDTVVSYYGNKNTIVPEPVENASPAPVTSSSVPAAEVSTLDQSEQISVEEMPGLVFEPVGENFIKEFQKKRADNLKSSAVTESEQEGGKELSDMVEFAPVNYDFTPSAVVKPVKDSKPVVAPETVDEVNVSAPVDFSAERKQEKSAIQEKTYTPEPSDLVKSTRSMRFDTENQQANSVIKSEEIVIETKHEQPQPVIPKSTIEIKEKQQDIEAQFDNHQVDDEMFASFVLTQKKQEPVPFVGSSLSDIKIEDVKKKDKPESVILFEAEKPLSGMRDPSNVLGAEDDGHLSHLPSTEFSPKTIISTPSVQKTATEEIMVETVIDDHVPEQILPRQEIFSIPIFSIDPSRKSLPETDAHSPVLGDSHKEDDEITEIDSFPLPSSFSMFEVEPDIEINYAPSVVEDTPTTVSSEFLFMPEMLDLAQEHLEKTLEPELEPEPEPADHSTQLIIDVGISDNVQKECNQGIDLNSVSVELGTEAKTETLEPQREAKEQLAAAVLNSQFMQVLIDALQAPVQEAVLSFLKEEMNRQTSQLVQTIEQQLPGLLSSTVEKYMKENQDDIINFEKKEKF